MKTRQQSSALIITKNQKEYQSETQKEYQSETQKQKYQKDYQEKNNNVQRI